MNNIEHPLRQLNIIYVVTTVFLVALSMYSVIKIRDLIDSSHLLTHTYEVKQALQKIEATVAEAESSKRGFLLTGDSSLLQKRMLAVQSLTLQQAQLDSLLQDNAEQVHNLALLRRVIGEKLVSISDMPVGKKNIQLRYETKINTMDGIQTMDSVKFHIEKMMMVETCLLLLHTQQFSQSSLVTPILIVVLFLGAVLILLISYYKLQKELMSSLGLHNQLFSLYEEKTQRAAELAIANKELLYQNSEKEMRAAELALANKELLYQNSEKEKRATELESINDELLFQSQEKEKRTVELLLVNKDLQLFTQISSHDLKEPLRKLQIAASRISHEDYNNLSEKGRGFFSSMRDAANTMQTLIDDLITYSETKREERTFVQTDLRAMIQEVQIGLQERIEAQHATIDIGELGEASIIPFQFRQLMHNILGNALKFSKPDMASHIVITGNLIKGKELPNVLAGKVNVEKFPLAESYYHIRISDNGIGFEAEYNEKIFEVFQRLHGKTEYKGTGIGLAIVKRIVENHNGIVTATGTLDEGAIFDIYLPDRHN
jgi:signal transduction histidine kinase